MTWIYGIFQINDKRDEYVSIRKDPDREYIRLYAANGAITDEEMALAHKIAAVDELLEMLKLVDDWLQEFIECDEVYSGPLANDEDIEFLVKLQAIIAKAEGKS